MNSQQYNLYSVEAERQVIGALLTYIEWFDDIVDIVKPTDFYIQEFRILFVNLQTLFNQNNNFDLLYFYEFLKKEYADKEFAQIDYLSNIAIVANKDRKTLRSYAIIIKKYSDMRRLIEILNKNAANIKCNSEVNSFSLDSFLDSLDSELSKLRNENTGNKDFSHIVHSCSELVNDLEQANKSPELQNYLLTGFKEFDAKTNGLHGGDLIIIAGRPAMGKTAFAMNIVENITIRNAKEKNRKIGVGIFSLEMTCKQLALRMISSLAEVKSSNLTTGNLTGDDMINIGRVFESFASSYIFIDDSGYITPSAIRSKSKRLAQRIINNNKGDNVKLDLIVIDYLQLINSDKNDSGKPTFFDKKELIPEITRSLKLLAKDLDVPIILLSQLNRENEKRTDKRPMLSDLRDSGAIEQDADMVVMMYREEYYNKGNPELKGKAEAIITKYRNGDTGTVQLRFDGDFTRFSNPVVNNNYQEDEFF